MTRRQLTTSEKYDLVRRLQRAFDRLHVWDAVDLADGLRHHCYRRADERLREVRDRFAEQTAADLGVDPAVDDPDAEWDEYPARLRAHGDQLKRISAGARKRVPTMDDPGKRAFLERMATVLRDMAATVHDDARLIQYFNRKLKEENDG